MNVIIAKGVVNSMTKDQLMISGLPLDAIEYYIKSLTRPITSLNDLPILVMITNLYIEIEMQLSHYRNLDLLVHSTMIILNANQKLIWSRYLRSGLFFCILVEFMHLAAKMPINSTDIPMHHWTTLFQFALKSAAELGIGGLIMTEIKLIDISWALLRPNLDLPAIGWKIVAWEHSLTQHERALKPEAKEMEWIRSMRARFLPLKIFWNANHWFFYSNQYCYQALQALLEYSTHRFELFSQRESTLEAIKSPFFNILLNTDLIPRVVYTIWYSGNEEILRRILVAFSTFKETIAYYDDVVSYLEVLIKIDFGTFTELEVGQFGPNTPQLLRWWQVKRLSNQLATSGFARTTRFQGSPRTVLSVGN